MKRKYLFASVLLISAFVLAQADPIVIDVLAYGREDNQAGRSFVKSVMEFEALHPDVDIRYTIAYGQAYHKLRLRRDESGNYPDMAFLATFYPWDREWRNAGLLMDHSEMLDPDLYDFNLLYDMDQEIPGKQIYYLPSGTPNLTTVLFMNTLLLSDLGFDTPETYEDLVAMVPKAKEAGVQVIGINGADGWAWGSCLFSGILGRLSGEPDWIGRLMKGEHAFTDDVMVRSMKLLRRMVEDGLISRDSVYVDYQTNLNNYCEGKTLFMVQGQWAANGIYDITYAVANVTSMISWPVLPGEDPATSGSVAGVFQTGYGILGTEKMKSDTQARRMAIEFLNYLNRRSLIDLYQKDGAIVAPLLKNYVPAVDLPEIIKSKIELARSVKVLSCVIDRYLAQATNDALNLGLRRIVTGETTPEQLAEELQRYLPY